MLHAHGARSWWFRADGGLVLIVLMVHADGSDGADIADGAESDACLDVAHRADGVH